MTNQREKEITVVTAVGGVINLLLLIFKFVAGVIGQSGAMVADAVHSLSDFATDAVVLVFVHISAKPRDKGHAYGHGKYEILATSLIALALFAVSVGIIVHSAKAIATVVQGGSITRPGLIAFIAAVVSVILKELMYQYTVFYGKKWKSQAVIANAWHHRSDAFSSVATCVGVGFAYFLGNTWTILDPIAALAVGALLIKVAYSLFMPAINDLVEGSLPEETEAEIMQVISEHPEVQNPHNLRTRHLGNAIAIDVHIRMAADMSVGVAHETTQKIEKALKDKYGANTWVMIHVEPVKIGTIKQ